MKTRLIAIVFLGFISTGALAASIGPDCKPNGPIAIAKEAWDSKAFWSGQLKEIQSYVDGQKTAYRLSGIERRRDRVNAGLDAEEYRALGIPQKQDPLLVREFANAEREMAALDLELVQHAIAWGNKCTAYARQKISQ